MPFALTISGLSKTYPNGVRALDDGQPDDPDRHVRPARAQRRRQVDADAHPRDAAGGRRAARVDALDDIDVLRDKAGVRRMLGYLPQDFGVYPKVVGRGHCSTTSRALKGLADRGAAQRDGRRRCCSRPTSTTCASKALGGFSGGMRQRFGIAQALLGDPRADHRRRADRRPRSRGARALPQPAGRDRRERDRASCRRTSSSDVSRPVRDGWRSSTRAACCSPASRSELDAHARRAASGRRPIDRAGAATLRERLTR